nr:hypothetical protein [Mycoplasmopsis bovis]
MLIQSQWIMMKKKKLKDKQEQDPVLQKVLGTWNKDFKNDIWANWSYKDIFEKLKSKIPDINLQLVRDPGIKPKPNSDSTNPPFVIKLNDSSNEQVLPFGKVWPISYWNSIRMRRSNNNWLWW